MGQKSYCGYDYISDFNDIPEKQEEIDTKVVSEGKLQTVNELNPDKDKLYNSNLSWFMEHIDDTGLSN